MRVRMLESYTKTLPWKEEVDEKKFKKVLEAFEEFCSPQRNLLYERHGFWQLSQQECESVDAYVTRLKLKVDYCEYDKTGWLAEVRAEMLRDKFVFGLRDDALKERLLVRDTTELTLELAMSLAQRSESSEVQVKEKSTASVNCAEIRRPTPQHSTHTSTHIPCRQCGRRHCPKEYPAYGQQCTKCHKLNHFARVCRSTRIFTGTPATHHKQVFTVEDSELNTSDSECTLVIDSIRIDGLKNLLHGYQL